MHFQKKKLMIFSWIIWTSVVNRANECSKKSWVNFAFDILWVYFEKHIILYALLINKCITNLKTIMISYCLCSQIFYLNIKLFKYDNDFHKKIIFAIALISFKTIMCYRYFKIYLYTTFIINKYVFKINQYSFSFI